MAPTTLPTILIAEDEMIVAFDLCETLEEAGFAIEGPHATVASARAAIAKHLPDLALLDVSLQDDLSYGLAKELRAQGVTVMFHSGIHTRGSIERNFPGAPVLLKPCPPSAILEAVAQLFDAPTMAQVAAARA